MTHLAEFLLGGIPSPKPKLNHDNQDEKNWNPTAGGDTPALNATIFGAVTPPNQLKVEVIGLICGFDSIYNPRVPHVHLNPLFRTIPELDADYGGTFLGASRKYVDPDDKAALDDISRRLEALKIEGLICIGGDGTLNACSRCAIGCPPCSLPRRSTTTWVNFPTSPTSGSG